MTHHYFAATNVIFGLPHMIEISLSGLLQQLLTESFKDTVPFGNHKPSGNGLYIDDLFQEILLIRPF